jgi:tetratricopeptide (TPR) repeat protein
MFFPRLRRQAKWVFVALALVFAGGFVVFGVGSGSTGISDVLSNVFGNGNGSGSSISKAQKQVTSHPNDPSAYRALATALEVKGRQLEAIAPLERYRQLRPNDTDALAELASIQTAKARQLASDAQLAQLEAQDAGAATQSAFGFQLPSGQSLGSSKIDQSLAQEATSRELDAQRAALAAAQMAEASYQKLADLTADPTTELELAQAASNAGDTTTALGAYERFLKLAPDDPNAPYVRRQVKQLKAALTGSAAG